MCPKPFFDTIEIQTPVAVLSTGLPHFFSFLDKCSSYDVVISTATMSFLCTTQPDTMIFVTMTFTRHSVSAQLRFSRTMSW